MTAITEDQIPVFPRGVRLRHDQVRDQWSIQAPERAFIADPVAATVLQQVDGAASLRTIIDHLAETYAAPRDVIARDVLSMARDLADRQVLIFRS